MIFENGDRIVFTGDSVTDMGRARPVGEEIGDNLGTSYVRIIDNMINAWYPDLRVRISNTGIAGHTSRDLLNRFDADVCALNPDWVSILIGINDVWRFFDAPALTDIQVGIEEYEKNLEEMIVRIKDKVKGVFILSPYYMEPNCEDMMRKKMGEYAAVARKLAEKHGCEYVDFQSVYDNFLKYRHSSFINWDRVHPNQIGATLMAKEFLKHCGFDYDHKY